MSIVNYENFIKFTTNESKIDIVYYDVDKQIKSCSIRLSTIVRLVEYILDDKTTGTHKNVLMELNLVQSLFRLQLTMKTCKVWYYDVDTKDLNFSESEIKKIAPLERKEYVWIEFKQGDFCDLLQKNYNFTTRVLKAILYNSDDCTVTKDRSMSGGYISLITDSETFPLTKEIVIELYNAHNKDKYKETMDVKHMIKFVNNLIKKGLSVYLDYITYMCSDFSVHLSHIHSLLMIKKSIYQMKNN